MADTTWNEAFEQALAPDSHVLGVEQLPRFLGSLHVQIEPQDLSSALQQLGLTEGPLTRDDVGALCQLLLGPSHVVSDQTSATSCSSVQGTAQSLTKQQAALVPEKLHAGEAMLLYMQQLDDHRKMCELTGRYAEAGAAASRIQDLKTAHAQRLRAELTAAQAKELSQLQQNFHKDTTDFDSEWHRKVAAYEAGVAAQLTALKAAHEAQMANFLLQCEVTRPAKPQHSAQYLNNRKIEERLVKQGQYRKAHELKVAADAMYHTELASTHAAWDLEVQIKSTKLRTKQQGELEVLLQRAARGRDELELRRLDDAEKRGNRFRCVVQDLDSIHRLEMVHLQRFLDGQGQVGKYVPLRDSTLPNKRELLGV